MTGPGARDGRRAAHDRGAGASRLEKVFLAGPAGRLEGLLLESRSREHARIAVVCHPHPLYGGTLHNKVVHRVATTLHALGAAVLRFNFRGAGESEGRHDQGRGEQDDARAAMAWLHERYPRAGRWLAGFSFGSWVAANVAGSDPDLERLILVAPPVTTSDFAVLRSCRVPKLVFQGTGDDVCAPAALEAEFPAWAEPKRLIWIDGATHFFDRQLGALAEALHQALAGRGEGVTS